jgi:hypothetical protein
VKVTVEVDCTPEEGRRFLGLPDVVPMQQAAMEKLQQRIVFGASRICYSEVVSEVSRQHKGSRLRFII